MKNLYPLTSDSFTYFENIIKAKRKHRKPILEALSDDIKLLYQEYGANISALELLTPTSLNAEQKEALQHCYLVPVQTMYELRHDIEVHQITCNADIAAFCQYCGLNYGAKTLDHYLPKDIFAEFSTLALNLVPCCVDCNTLKDTAWLKGSEREIISFYYDSLPTTQFLFADLAKTGNVYKPSFHLSLDASDYCGMEATIRGHFNKLDLLNRYADASAPVISEQQGLIESIATEHIIAGLGFDDEEIIDLIVHILTKNAVKLGNNLSINHWKVPLYQSISANRNFIKSCI
ncbi:hypothetical protein [Hymenobacter algoricola]|uniref:HNH endonuclease n=1 Tax=Hymenobacter algoricola TaxID=486267 RepID=A0ABP7NF37_9BACT